MLRLLLVYQVRPEATQRFLQAANDLVAAIAAQETGTKYEVYQARQEACFYHYAVFADEAARTRHLASAHHLAFDAVVRDVCARPAKAIVLEKITAA